MADLNGGSAKGIYSHQYNDEKHVPGTTRLKEHKNKDHSELILVNKTKYSNRLIDRIKKHWLIDFIPIILETIFWLYVIGRFYDAAAYVAFMIPGIPILLYLLTMLVLEIIEWFVFNKKAKRYKNVIAEISIK